MYIHILANIIKILKTDIQWKYLNLDNISYRTVNKYFNFLVKKRYLFKIILSSFIF